MSEFKTNAGQFPSDTSGSPIAGLVDSAGNVVGGTGFTVTKTGTGLYGIDFPGRFPLFPIAIFQSSGIVGVSTVNLTPSHVGIQIFATPTGAPTDSNFSFVAYDPS